MARLLPLVIAGAVVEAVLLYWVSLGELAGAVIYFWAGLVPLGLAYVVAGRWVATRPGGLGWILALAVLFRCTMLFSPPSLSDDIYRYVWDGRQQLAGINPYLHPPESEAVASLRDELYAGINNKDIPTIYPPVAQFFFALLAWGHPALLTVKAGLVLVDMALVLLLTRMLARRGADSRRVILYAWHPLPLVEVAASGHIDVLGVFLALAGLYFLENKRAAAAVLSLAAGFLTKLLPLLFLPVFWRELGPCRSWRQWLSWRPRAVLLLFPLTVIVAFVPFAAAGEKLLSGLQAYVLRWRFNDALFSVLYSLLKDPHLEWDDAALQGAKILCAVAVIAVALWALWRRPDPVDAAFVILATYLLLTPTLHPWYLLWAMPFVALKQRPAWALLGFSVFLAYQVLIGYSTSGIWQEKTWVLWAEFIPFYAVGALGFYRRRFSRTLPPEHPVRAGVSPLL
jgi:alpha-1,6-mannosyltransferase